jgi:hypothetical protein
VPRLAGYKVSMIRELGRQLRYAPPETRRRHMEAAEQLVAEIDPSRLYPSEFVVYKITGYRPEAGEQSVSLVGAALVSDLVTLVQRLSESIEIPAGEGGRDAVRFDRLGLMLGVSLRTLQRYRREGLVCHYVVFSDGVKRLACFQDAVKRFVDGHRARVDRAATYTRLPEPQRQAIVAEARLLRRAEELSLNNAARRLARRHGRAHETVRAILRRHERSSDEAIFAETGPLRARHRRFVHRAVGFGIPVGTIASHLGKTRPTIHRALNRRRAELLRSLHLRFVELPIMERPEAEPVVLAADAVARGLDDLLPQADALTLLEAARAAPNPEENLERSLLAGCAILKHRARDGIAGLDEQPSAESLDEIETQLRWASALKRRLVSLGMPAAIVAVERTLGRPLYDCPADEIVALLRLAACVVAGVVETIDPARDQRLAHAAGFATNRRLAAAEAPSRGRAARRHEPGSVPLGELFEGLDPWHRWLELRPELARLAGRLPSGPRSLLVERYGLEGERPGTIAEIAARRERPAMTIAVAVARAETRLRRLRR